MRNVPPAPLEERTSFEHVSLPPLVTSGQRAPEPGASQCCRLIPVSNMPLAFPPPPDVESGPPWE